MKKGIIIVIGCVLLSVQTLMGQNNIDTLEVAVMKTSQIIFPDPILPSSLDIGSLSIDAKVSANQLSLFSKEEGFVTTNLSVQTYADGVKTYYMYILTYNENPPAELLFKIVDKKEAVHSVKSQNEKRIDKREKKGKVMEQNGRAKSKAYGAGNSDGTGQEVENAKTIAELAKEVEGLKSTHSSIGVKESKMLMYIDAIYVHEDYLFVRVNCLNQAAIRYDLDFVNFAVAGSEGLKKKVTESSNLSILHPSSNEIESDIEDGETFSKVFVLNKVTFDRKEKLVVDLREEGGDRNLSVQINSKDILDAEAF